LVVLGNDLGELLPVERIPPQSLVMDSRSGQLGARRLLLNSQRRSALLRESILRGLLLEMVLGGLRLELRPGLLHWSGLYWSWLRSGWWPGRRLLELGSRRFWNLPPRELFLCDPLLEQIVLWCESRLLIMLCHHLG